MPVTDGIGHGAITARKYEYLRRIFDMHLAVTRAVLTKWRDKVESPIYRYIDLTAGTGRVPDTRDPGSALVFLDAVETQPGEKLAYRMDLVEQKKANFDTLVRNVDVARDTYPQRGGQVLCHRGAYQQVISRLLDEGSPKEYGLAFVDPSGTAPDLAALTEISARRSTLEILIYVSASNLKRGQPTTGIQIGDYIGGIKKKHWLVRKPDVDDKHQWTFLLGTNGGGVFKSYPGIRLYDVSSRAGGEILEKLSLTRKQRTDIYQIPLLGVGDDALGDDL